jgi:hypothetical protein
LKHEIELETAAMDLPFAEIGNPKSGQKPPKIPP